MPLHCEGTLRVALDDGSQHDVALAQLTFAFIDTFEPSLVLVHNYEAARPGEAPGARVRVEVVEASTGMLFATLALRGAACVGGVRGLKAVCDGSEVELRLPRSAASAT